MLVGVVHICARFLLALVLVFMFAFVLAIDANTECWWLPWSSTPGLAWRASARGSGVGNAAGAADAVIYPQCMVNRWAKWKAGGAHLGSCPIPIPFVNVAGAVHCFRGAATLRLVFIVFEAYPHICDCSLS